LPSGGIYGYKLICYDNPSKQYFRLFVIKIIIPGSSNGRTQAFGAWYLGSIPSPGANNMSKPAVYLLLSLKDHRTYLGSTDNILKRLSEHNKGRVLATKHRRPLKLIYCEELNSLKEAREKEKYYKYGAGRKKLRMIFMMRDRPPRVDKSRESRRASLD
jgi:putative endonuclease